MNEYWNEIEQEPHGVYEMECGYAVVNNGKHCNIGGKCVVCKVEL